ncbi:hypothetical protein GCM10018963_50760 [Saccharothrix longispora]
MVARLLRPAAQRTYEEVFGLAYVVLSGCRAPAGVFGCFAALDGGRVWRPFTDAYR